MSNRPPAFTEEELEKFRKGFESLPSYNAQDGTIHGSEHGKFMAMFDYPFTEEQRVQYWNIIRQIRGDDRIDWDLMYKLCKFQHCPYALGNEYAEAFDLDKDGFIDAKEFKLIMETMKIHDPVLYEQKKPQNFEQFVKEADTNKDGKVSIKEFATWMDA